MHTSKNRRKSPYSSCFLKISSVYSAQIQGNFYRLGETLQNSNRLMVSLFFGVIVSAWPSDFVIVSRCHFFEQIVSECHFSEQIVSRCHFSEQIVSRCHFFRVIVSGCHFFRVIVSECHFSRANRFRVSLFWANRFIVGVTFFGKSFQGCQIIFIVERRFAEGRNLCTSHLKAFCERYPDTIYLCLLVT